MVDANFFHAKSHFLEIASSSRRKSWQNGHSKSFQLQNYPQMMDVPLDRWR